MARWTTPFAGTVQSALDFDEPTNACWFVAADGQIWSFRVLGQRLRAFGSGWNDAVSVVPSTDGLHLFVVLSSGDVAVVKRESADRTDATVLVSIGATAVAAHRRADNSILVLDDSGRVHQVTPSDGTFNALVDVEGATLLTVDEAAGEILLAIPDATTEVRRFGLDGTAVGTPVDVAAHAVALAPPPPGATGVVVCDDTGAILHEDWSGTVDPVTFVIAGASSICRWHSLFIGAASASMRWWSGATTSKRCRSRQVPIRSCRQDGRRCSLTMRQPGLRRLTSNGASMRAHVRPRSRSRNRQAVRSSIA